MRFGPVPVAEAQGAILAHAASVPGGRLRKGRALTAEDVEALRAAGFTEVIVARPEAGDLVEDEAAARIGAALATKNVEARPAATGRVNLHAGAAGVFTVSKTLVDAINRIDPAITLATLAEFASVETGRMVATVKIIPFAVASATVEQAVGIAAAGGVFDVRPFARRKVGLVQTTLPTVKDSVLDKTARITAARLARSESAIAREMRVAHETGAVAGAIAECLAAGDDLVVVFGASAMCDADDVIPAAIRRAGGSVARAGMPVDPGNLIALGAVRGVPVIGAPGCARSPKENGFDWVLDRIVAGIEVTGDDIAAMGVGGLLMEIATRPQPREAPSRPKEARVHAVLLAAGRSSRMGGPNKLLARLDGETLVRRVAGRLAASRAAGITVVLGHQAGQVRAALDGLDLELIENPAYAGGLSTSLRAGIASVPEDCAGALVALGDMPGLATADYDRLIAAFAEAGGRAVVRATHNGKRGNPIVLPRALFAAVAELEGDVGARHLIEAGDAETIDVEIGASASLDLDTPEAMEAAGGVL